ncbi:MAG: DUF1573 domain-containing protein [Parcubacteria group bacterium]|nr:DUF1573 domain-containing protein [Parcubacteria group bacterium]
MFKKYQNIFILIFAVFLFGFLVWIARPQTAESDANIISSSSLTAFTAPEEFFDFGTISMGKGKVSHLFALKNENSEPISIKKIYTSCMCTEATLIRGDARRGPFGMPGHGSSAVNEQINPGEEITIEAVFDPAAHGPAGVGNIERVVFIETSAGKNELNFKAQVTP